MLLVLSRHGSVFSSRLRYVAYETLQISGQDVFKSLRLEM
jgi:hypothetical protein